MRKRTITTVAAALLGLAGSADAQTVVNTDVVAPTTWCDAANPGPIILDGAIFVRDGGVLTILPGCIVRGQPRTAAVVPGVTTGTPGTLIVTQTGMIKAEGTKNSPVIFTTAAVDNNADGIADDDDSNGFKDAWAAGDLFLDSDPLDAPLAPLDKAGRANVALWGGVVILGNAPTNLASGSGVGFGKGIVEGLTVPGFPGTYATYGGEFAHDNSGVLRYASIRHGGDEIGNSNELNCLSMGGVGDGTVIDHVECYTNFDDGFEWFGGTVEGSHLASFYMGDDSFDLDQGYTGVGQFYFAIQTFFNQNNGSNYGSASGDRATEFDGDDSGNTSVRVGDGICWPFSAADVYNMTVIGSTPPGANPAVSPASANLGIVLTNNYAGRIANSIVVNTGTAPGLSIPLGSSGCSAAGFTTHTNVTAGRTEIVSTTFADGAAPTAGSIEETAILNGNATAALLGGTANSVYQIGFQGLVNEDATFDPTGNAAGKLDASLKASPINPRPKPGIVGVGLGIAPTRRVLDPSAKYRGAFPASTNVELWTTGWTALNRGGLLAN